MCLRVSMQVAEKPVLGRSCYTGATASHLFNVVLGCSATKTLKRNSLADS